MGNVCGRLFQGLRDIKGTNTTCVFIGLKNIPKDRKITYCTAILCVISSCKKRSRSVSESQLELIYWITPARWQCLYQTSPPSNSLSTVPYYFVHRIHINDDDGYQELLFGNTSCQVCVHAYAIDILSSRHH
jgi:hypothetical protein